MVSSRLSKAHSPPVFVRRMVPPAADGSPAVEVHERNAFERIGRFAELGYPVGAAVGGPQNGCTTRPAPNWTPQSSGTINTLFGVAFVDMS